MAPPETFELLFEVGGLERFLLTELIEYYQVLSLVEGLSLVTDEVVVVVGGLSESGSALEVVESLGFVGDLV